MKRLFIALLLGVGITVTFLGILKPVAYARPIDPPLAVDILRYIPPQQAGTGIIRVALTGSNVPGCGSVASPCATVQFAVDEALPGEEIRIAGGSYTGVQIRNGLTQTVYISKPLTLRGGYSTADGFANSNPVANPTILDAQSNGRVILVTDTVTTTLENLTITGGFVAGLNLCTGNDPSCGGGIFTTGPLTLNNVNVIDNQSNRFGGGIAALTTTVINNSHFENNAGLSGFSSGGGLYVEGAVTINNSNFISNTADGGGGVQVSQAPVQVTGSTFERNTARNGGGLLMSAGNVVSQTALIINSTFLSNTVTCPNAQNSICDGGAVYAFHMEMGVVDSLFENNACNDPFNDNCDGGAIVSFNSFIATQLWLTNTNFISNSAGTFGGGVSVGNFGKTVVNGGRFERNFAGGVQTAFSDGGGGLAVGRTLEVRNAQFINNTSGEDGGAIWVQQEALIENTQFSFNQAITDGGAVRTGFSDLTLVNSNFIGNNAGYNGGGLYTSNQATIIGGRFERNRADGPPNDGGFIKFERGGGGAWIGGMLNLTDTQFISNTARTNGGGAHVRGLANINGGLFDQNESLGDFVGFSFGGGGLYVNDNLTSINTLFTNNRAVLLGGGVNAVGATVLSGGAFQNNTATASNGGGIRAAGSLTADGTQFIGNISGFAGGGAQAGGPADIRNALFQNNQADNGGGLQLNDAATIDNVQFVNNRAITSTGGGLVSTFAPLTVTNSLFQDNSSASSGGGLNAFATFGDTINVIDSQIINNTADANGGGLSLSGAFFITDTLIQNNRALNGNGGGLYTASAANFGGNWEVSNNTAAGDGGGIWANSGLNATNGRIENNSSSGSGGGFYGGLGSLNVNGTVFANNQAGDGDGGGAYAFNADAVGNALFEGNSATGAGGGLFLQRFVHITTTQFLGNDATLGGGMAISRTRSGSFVQFVHNSLFARNTATANGASIYWNQPRPIDLIHNTIAGPGTTPGAAIHIVTGTVNITNNIIANHATGIQVVDGAVTENYNLYSGNTTNTSGPMSGGFGSLTGNPAFQNPATDDYHLTNASQAISLGTDAGINTDFDNDPRPNIGGFDVGYDETAFAPILSVSKTAAPASNAPYQGEIVYTVVLSNTGDLDAVNTMLTDTLPAEVDFDRFIQANGATVLNDEITWSGNVPINTGLTFSFVVSHTGNFEDVFTNTVEVGHTAITSSITDSAVVTVEPQVADLLISKSSVRDEDAGVISYTIVVQNLGPYDAGDVIVSDPIPAGISAFSWQCASSGGATCTANGTGNINDTLTSFPVGGQVIYTVQATMVSTDVTVVNTATLLLPPGLTNTAPTNSAINTSAPVGNIFLPIVMVNTGSLPSPPPSPPDLIVDSLVATSTGVTVTIKNIGSGPVVDAFWVDVYIDPDTPPTTVNQRWQDVGSQGLVWGVVAPALPIAANGGTLTLTLNDAYYFTNRSNFNPPLAVDTPVYAQVDSVNLLTNYGGVLEDHEVNGGAYNNINSTLSVFGSSEAAALSTADDVPSIPTAFLPQRE